MKKMIMILGLMSLSLMVSHARNYEACFQQAAEKHDVPMNILLAVAFTESSFKAKAHNRNRNGTRDYGFMQVNSIWAKQAKQMGYSWQQVKHNPCTNIMFGSHILKSNKKRLGSWSQAVGAYNAGFSKSKAAQKRRHRYYTKVVRNKGVAKQHMHRLR